MSTLSTSTSTLSRNTHAIWAEKMESKKTGTSWKIKLLQSSFWVKLTHWEFWDFNVVYALTGILHLWQSLKSGSFFYFSAANPGLENSGFIGETKSSIMALLPEDKQPAWFLVSKESVEMVLQSIEKHQLTFPLIAKPNVGERGKGVSKINSEQELRAYHNQISVPYIVQTYVDLPLELGVFYYRFPNQPQGVVSSVVKKGFLTLAGDGKSTLNELVEANPRASFVADYLSRKFENRWNEVLPKGEKLELEGIGNHCRGTTFLNGNGLISERLIQVFDALSQSVPGFYFGRYDLRAASVEALEKGDFQILELNGAGAEPAHIYQPGFSFWEGQRVLLHHWQVLHEISRQNHEAGVPFWTLKQARSIRKKHLANLSSIGNV